MIVIFFYEDEKDIPEEYKYEYDCETEYAYRYHDRYNGKVIHIAKKPPLHVKVIPTPNGNVIKALYFDSWVEQERGDRLRGCFHLLKPAEFTI